MHYVLSFERNHNRLSTQLTVGYLTKIFKEQTSDYAYSGLKIAIEEKWFLTHKIHSHNRKTRPYLSIESAYVKTSKTDIVKYGDQEFINGELITHSSYNDSVKINRNAILINSKFGIQITAGQFIFEVNAGPGVRFTNNTYSERINVSDERFIYENLELSGLVPDQNKEGLNAVFNLPVDIKVGYIF